MDKRVLIVLVLVVVIVAGVGAALLLLNRQPASIPTPTASPVASPVTTTQTQPALTAITSSPLTTAGQGQIDIYLDAKAEKLDGFQFIGTLSGTSLPVIPDADPVTDGIQIQATSIPELSVSTNSVTEQDGGFVIRFAMVAQDSTVGFSNTSPVKVATILVSNGSAGSLSFTFNQQNSRARLASGGEDALINTTDATFPVSVESVANASGSGNLIAQATPASQTTGTSVVTSSPTPTPNTALSSQFCLASCFTDSDCAAGFACETDRCVNPACPTSQTCGCGASALATPVATVAPIATTTALATIAPTSIPTEAPVASASADLPVSGSFEYTLLTLGAGLLLIGGGVFLTAKQTT